MKFGIILLRLHHPHLLPNCTRTLGLTCCKLKLFPNGKDPAVCLLQQALLIDMWLVLSLGTALLHLHHLSILLHAIAISPWPLLLFAALSPSK